MTRQYATHAGRPTLNARFCSGAPQTLRKWVAPKALTSRAQAYEYDDLASQQQFGGSSFGFGRHRKLRPRLDLHW